MAEINSTEQATAQIEAIKVAAKDFLGSNDDRKVEGFARLFKSLMADAHAAGKQEAEQTGFIQIPGCKPDSIGAYESWIEKRIMQSQAIINLLGQSHEGDPSDTDLSNAAWGAYDLLDEAMVILSKMGDVARAGA